MQQTQGFAHFLLQADGIILCLLLVMTIMSVITWYLIITKSIANWRMRRQGQNFLRLFWESPGMEAVAMNLKQRGVHDPFSHLTHHALRAADQYRNKKGGHLVASGSAEEFLTRALRRAIEQNTTRLEYGLTLLASVASSAPFVGLFGTVWGIYHALLNIGMSNQGTLNQVAGPVGEALIMTALGLAVAIPAVLAYNALNRTNRIVLTELDGFAHDLFAFMSTGSRADDSTAPAVTKIARGKITVLAQTGEVA